MHDAQTPGSFLVVHTESPLLTAGTEAEHLLRVALVLHHLTVAEREVVGGVSVHPSQQPGGGVREGLRQEHGGRHGSFPEPHLHPGPAAEHHRHICGRGRKHGDAWETSSWRLGGSSESEAPTWSLGKVTVQVHPALLREGQRFLIPQHLQAPLVAGETHLNGIERGFFHRQRCQFCCIYGFCRETGRECAR